MVIVKLHTLGLLNDQAYAELYVDSHAGIGHGAHRLRQDMHRKGIDEETIRAALERLDPDVLRRIRPYLAFFSSIAAQAAARRAIGTRNGEQDT